MKVNKGKVKVVDFLLIVSITFSALLLTYIVMKKEYNNFSNSNKSEMIAAFHSKLESAMHVLNVTSAHMKPPFRKEMNLMDSLENIKTFSEIFPTSKYCYYFSETNCFTCVEEFAPYLKKIIGKVGAGNVVILGSFSTPAVFFSKVKSIGVSEVEAYNIDPKLEGTHHEFLSNMPFICKIQQGGSVSEFFIPEKTVPELSEIYFQQIPKK